MSEALSTQPTPTPIEKKVAEIPDLVAFGVVVIIAWLVTDYMERELQGAGILPLYAVIARWSVFVLMLLIYYGLIRIRVQIRKKFREHYLISSQCT